MARVQDKVAIVTGGATGLGEASAALLAREGARVVITDLNTEKGQEVADRLGEAVSFVESDVTRESDWQSLIDTVLSDYGKLNILVNNAGVGIPRNIEETTLDEWQWVMRANMDGVFLGTRYGIHAMREHGSGSIINMSSVEGMVGDSRLTAYNASKSGVVGLTKSAALHCAQNRLNIRVNSVHPGFIWTKMVKGFIKSQDDPDATREALQNAHPVGDLGEPQDVAYGVLYLASDESKFVTGTQLVIDGGYTAQ